MKLRDFISETIEEIAFGVHKAKVKTKDLVAVSPGSINGELVTRMTEVEFDVAVTVAETERNEASGEGRLGGELKVVGVQISAAVGGSKAKDYETSNSSVSRVAFKVPVYLNAHMRNDPSIERERRMIDQLESDPSQAEGKTGE